jgi:NAD(P)H dehydrogenase (quinone)
MHVLTVVCHPKPSSFSHAVAAQFIAGAERAGHTVELADLYAEGFDPIVSERDLQQFDGVEMPDDVLQEQARVERSDALCLVFPIWWYGAPAMMKGWLDRVWSAGWAYTWHQEPEGSLLPSRPCAVLVPMGASRRQLDRWGYDNDLENLWRYGVLGYCGVDPIRLEFLEDSGWDTGVHLRHLETAYDAGVNIEADPRAKPGIQMLLDAGRGRASPPNAETGT